MQRLLGEPQPADRVAADRIVYVDRFDVRWRWRVCATHDSERVSRVEAFRTQILGVKQRSLCRIPPPSQRLSSGQQLIGWLHSCEHHQLHNIGVRVWQGSHPLAATTWCSTGIFTWSRLGLKSHDHTQGFDIERQLLRRAGAGSADHADPTEVSLTSPACLTLPFRRQWPAN